VVPRAGYVTPRKDSMSRSTISTFKLFELFADEQAARTYLEARLWPAGVKCPYCGSMERITARKGGYYRCNACRPKLTSTVRTGTIMERSHIPLHKWLYAMYLVVTARKGVSSMQLAKEIGVTQKSAWFMLGRLREACGAEIDKLHGEVEIDETFVGGLEANKHEAERSTGWQGVDRMKDVPEFVDRVTDAVLAYKPKPKTKAMKRRVRREKYRAKRRELPPGAVTVERLCAKGS
jgi:transposase-like protein